MFMLTVILAQTRLPIDYAAGALPVGDATAVVAGTPAGPLLAKLPVPPAPGAGALPVPAGILPIPSGGALPVPSGGALPIPAGGLPIPAGALPAPAGGHSVKRQALPIPGAPAPPGPEAVTGVVDKVKSSLPAPPALPAGVLPPGAAVPSGLPAPLQDGAAKVSSVVGQVLADGQSAGAAAPAAPAPAGDLVNTVATTAGKIVPAGVVKVAPGHEDLVGDAPSN